MVSKLEPEILSAVLKTRSVPRIFESGYHQLPIWSWGWTRGIVLHYNFNCFYVRTSIEMEERETALNVPAWRYPCAFGAVIETWSTIAILQTLFSFVCSWEFEGKLERKGFIQKTIELHVSTRRLGSSFNRSMNLLRHRKIFRHSDQIKTSIKCGTSSRRYQ